MLSVLFLVAYVCFRILMHKFDRCRSNYRLLMMLSKMDAALRAFFTVFWRVSRGMIAPRAIEKVALAGEKQFPKNKINFDSEVRSSSDVSLWKLVLDLWEKLSIVLIFIISLNGVFLFFTGNKHEIYVETVIVRIGMLHSMKMEVSLSSSLWRKRTLF